MIFKNLTIIAALIVLVGCNERKIEEKPAAVFIEPKMLTDALYKFALASRNAYATNVVTSLSVQRKIIGTSENWQTEHVLPIPAQMVRYTNETFSKSESNVSVQLKSLWPLNPNNAPKGDVETEGLKVVSDNQAKQFYKMEKTPSGKVFTAVYADTAGSLSCVRCHNAHPKGNKRDYKGGDVLGGFVVTLKIPN